MCYENIIEFQNSLLFDLKKEINFVFVDDFFLSSNITETGLLDFDQDENYIEYNYSLNESTSSDDDNSDYEQIDVILTEKTTSSKKIYEKSLYYISCFVLFFFFLKFTFFYICS